MTLLLPECAFGDRSRAFRQTGYGNESAQGARAGREAGLRAYVLCPFPTFAIIGPRVLKETRTSLPALHVELTVEDIAWLNLEED